MTVMYTHILLSVSIEFKCNCPTWSQFLFSCLKFLHECSEIPDNVDKYIQGKGDS